MTSDREEIRKVLFDFTGVHIQIKDLKHVAGGTLIHLDSWATKRRLMENKFKLRATKILTCREQEVQRRINEVAEEASRRGSYVRIFYMGWQINNMEFLWNEEEGRVKESVIDTRQGKKFFRGRGGSY